GQISSGAGLSSGWYHLVCVFDDANNTVKVYRNGTQILNATSVTQTPQSNASDLLYVGGGGYSEPFPGKIDEARVSLSTRTVDWVTTSYNNQSSPNSFYAYGAVQANTRQTSGGGISPAIKVRGKVKLR
ncbi:MAG: trimeric autotransporter adhesin, partial [Patescibacteria group bacterium]|nr:trimeric autotransporter adhesin [Patescibacteria group bacterium]